MAGQGDALTSQEVDGVVVAVCGGQRCAVLGAGATAGGKHGVGVLDAFRAVVRGTAGGVLLRTGCLGLCVRSPVVAVAPRPAGETTAGVATFLGPVTRAGEVERVGGWVRDGGPVARPLPGPLRHLVFDPRQP